MTTERTPPAQANSSEEPVDWEAKYKDLQRTLTASQKKAAKDLAAAANWAEIGARVGRVEGLLEKVVTAFGKADAFSDASADITQGLAEHTARATREAESINAQRELTALLLEREVSWDDEKMKDVRGAWEKGDWKDALSKAKAAFLLSAEPTEIDERVRAGVIKVMKENFKIDITAPTPTPSDILPPTTAELSRRLRQPDGNAFFTKHKAEIQKGYREGRYK